MLPKSTVDGVDLRVVAVIPARLNSTRLPRKVLREIAGKPLLGWVYEAAVACPQFDQVVIAVDSPVVADLCQRSGWPWKMTSPDLPSGTDRLAEVARSVEAEIYVNVQGDEPLITSSHISALLSPFSAGNVDASTLKTRCQPHEVADPNAVKVVTASDGRALYFSRATLPYDRDKNAKVTTWKHLGLYAYRRETLLRFAALPPGELEQIERLEQLRLLENNFALYVTPVNQITVGVDTEEDLKRVQTILEVRRSQPART